MPLPNGHFQPAELNMEIPNILLLSEFIDKHKLIASAALVLCMLLLRMLIVFFLRKRPAGESELPKRLINSINNITSLMIFVGLIIVWLSEIRFVALSIATFSVALVLAAREFIQCIMGSFYLASTRLFSIGDWIKVGSNHGEVIRSDWLSTSLLEVDMDSHGYSYTGKTLVVPNNQFTSSSITNLNFMRRYIAHSFSIICAPNGQNPFEYVELLIEKSQLYCKSFNEVAERYSGLIEKRLGIVLPGPEPSVRITTTKLGKFDFSITIFCPTHDAIDLEQKITRDFLNIYLSSGHGGGVTSDEESASAYSAE